MQVNTYFNGTFEKYCLTVFTRIWSSPTAFSTNNNAKCFLSMLKVHLYRKTMVRKWLLYTAIIIHNFTIFTVFLIKWMHPWWAKLASFKTINLTDPKLLTGSVYLNLLWYMKQSFDKRSIVLLQEWKGLSHLQIKDWKQKQSIRLRQDQQGAPYHTWHIIPSSYILQVAFTVKTTSTQHPQKHDNKTTSSSHSKTDRRSKARRRTLAPALQELDLYLFGRQSSC